MNAPTDRQTGDRRGWYRTSGPRADGAGDALVWGTARDDTSPAHITYPTGYDSRCSYCWLGQGHTEAAHTASLDGDHT
jgi:hypothetical protein